jgi:hypothetical protein
MAVQAQDLTAEPILKRLTTAFASHTTIEQTKGNTKREPYDRREHA